MWRGGSPDSFVLIHFLRGEFGAKCSQRTSHGPIASPNLLVRRKRLPRPCPRTALTRGRTGSIRATTTKTAAALATRPHTATDRASHPPSQGAVGRRPRRTVSSSAARKG